MSDETGKIPATVPGFPGSQVHVSPRGCTVKLPVNVDGTSPRLALGVAPTFEAALEEALELVKNEEKYNK